MGLNKKSKEWLIKNNDGEYDLCSFCKYGGDEFDKHDDRCPIKKFYMPKFGKGYISPSDEQFKRVGVDLTDNAVLKCRSYESK